MTVVALVPLARLWPIGVGVEGHFSAAVGVVVSAAGRATLMDHDAVQVIDLIRQVLLWRLAVDGFVHVGFGVEAEWVLDLGLDLATEDVESLDCEDQNAWRLVYRGPFRRVLLRLTLRTQVLVVLGEVINRAELSECLSEALLVFLATKLHWQGKCLVECVGLVIASFTGDLRAQFAAENLEQRSLRLIFDHVRAAWLFAER